MVEECLMFEERFFKNPLSDALVVPRCSATSELSQQQSVKRRKRGGGGGRERNKILATGLKANIQQ